MACFYVASEQQQQQQNIFAILKGCQQNRTKQNLRIRILNRDQIFFSKLKLFTLCIFTEALQCIMIFTLNNKLTFKEI